jgi:hypothetical protein
LMTYQSILARAWDFYCESPIHDYFL